MSLSGCRAATRIVDGRLTEQEMRRATGKTGHARALRMRDLISEVGRRPARPACPRRPHGARHGGRRRGAGGDTRAVEDRAQADRRTLRRVAATDIVIRPAVDSRSTAERPPVAPRSACCGSTAWWRPGSLADVDVAATSRARAGERSVGPRGFSSRSRRPPPGCGEPCARICHRPFPMRGTPERADRVVVLGRNAAIG